MNPRFGATAGGSPVVESAAMNETDVRRVLLVRAFEAPMSAPWTQGDAAWASREAARAEGERASGEQLIAARARLAIDRLAEREPAVRAVLGATGHHGWIGSVFIAVAFAAGLAADAVGSPARVNILAPPLLALLAWNLAVYALMIGHRLHRGHTTAPATGPVRRAFALVQQRLGAAAIGRTESAANGSASRGTLARYLADWARIGAPLESARLARALHWSAAALAAGALAGLYLRGLAFEYRAGWDSTFLTPSAVHRLLGVVLGPASRLSGLPLPGADALAGLRFSAGPGENAAAWIHLHALTIAGVVLLPRALLAAWAARRARQRAERLPLPLDDEYFRRLAQAPGDQPLAVHALPYSYRIGAGLQRGLADVLERQLGPRVSLKVGDPLPQGAQDDALEALLPRGGAPATVVALFALTATPERETHGAFLRQLASRWPAPVVVLVDESGFAQRFAGTPEFESRREQRRAAWRSVLGDAGHAPLFADLSEHRA